MLGAPVEVGDDYITCDRHLASAFGAAACSGESQRTETRRIITVTCNCEGQTFYPRAGAYYLAVHTDGICALEVDAVTPQATPTP